MQATVEVCLVVLQDIVREHIHQAKERGDCTCLQQKLFVTLALPSNSSKIYPFASGIMTSVTGKANDLNGHHHAWAKSNCRHAGNR